MKSMNFSLGMSMSGIVAVIVATMASPASAQPPWLQNTPLDPSTYPGAIKDVGQAASQVLQGVLPRAPQPSVSGLDVLTPPHMDRDGFIYSGTTNTSQSRNRVGRGLLHINAQGIAFWYSSYHDYGGRVNSPVRAYERYDRPQASQHPLGMSKPPSAGPGRPPGPGMMPQGPGFPTGPGMPQGLGFPTGPGMMPQGPGFPTGPGMPQGPDLTAGQGIPAGPGLMPGQDPSAGGQPQFQYALRIDPSNGQIFQGTFAGQQLVAEQVVGQAQLLQNQITGSMDWVPPPGFPVNPVQAVQ
jgi:hypothetical protein